MPQRKRMKLCPSCDGFVDLDVIICPYCGNNVSESTYVNNADEDEMEEKSLGSSMTPEESLSALYPPPYQPKNVYFSEQKKFPKGYLDSSSGDGAKENFSNPSKMDSFQSYNVNPTTSTEDKKSDPFLKNNTLIEEKKDSMKKGFSFASALPIILFSLGVNFFLLAIYLFCFSTNGEIFIRWNGSIWFVYLLVAIPFIIVGYRMLSKEESSS